MSFDPRIHKFSNNAAGKLASELSDAATSLSLQGGQGAAFPELAGGEIFKITVTDFLNNIVEIMHCTARVGDELTVERAQEGTDASEFSEGTLVQHCVTAGTLEWLQSLLESP